MKISPQWLREFVDIPSDDRALAEELTHTGTAVESVAQEGGQAIFEMEITTNRVDAMNHYGIARECSAIYDRDLKPIAPRLPKVKEHAKFPIEIEDAGGCARYTARMIQNVKIGPSPTAVAERLALVGASSISNAVDASNYALVEMGHPTHAFDMDLLAGGKIVVRRARKGESVKTLDGVERKLEPDDLVIADDKRPVALAGIMGGFDTMITDKTKNILIESAWFDPATVRRTARRLGMHTDASHRFERGADFGATPFACARVAELILQSAGGELCGAETDTIGRKLARKPLKLRRREIVRILGQEISDKDVKRILGRLGFGLHSSKPGEWQVTLPTWRLDVEREIDLIEEIARLHGYNNFRNTLPAFRGSVVELPHERKQHAVRGHLLALGYDEAISTTFISHAEAEQFVPGVKPVELANPLSEEAAVMRTSLVPGILGMLAHNLNRGVTSARLFESGNVFEVASNRTREQMQLCLGATGNVVEASAHETARAYSFFDLKGAVEEVLGAFEHNSIYFDADAQTAHYHAGRSARVALDGRTVARLGQLSAEIAATRKFKQDIYVAEIFLDRVYEHELRQAKYGPLSKYPAVERDFSFIFPSGVTFEQVRGAVDRLGIAELRSVTTADLLQGKAAERASVPAGKYSLLLRASFQSHERTLRDDEVAAWAKQIIGALEKLGGTLRA